MISQSRCFGRFDVCASRVSINARNSDVSISKPRPFRRSIRSSEWLTASTSPWAIQYLTLRAVTPAISAASDTVNVSVSGHTRSVTVRVGFCGLRLARMNAFGFSPVSSNVCSISSACSA